MERWVFSSNLLIKHLRVGSLSFPIQGLGNSNQSVTLNHHSRTENIASIALWGWGRIKWADTRKELGALMHPSLLLGNSPHGPITQTYASLGYDDFFLCTNSCLAVIKAIIVVYVVNKIASNCLLLPYKMFWKGFVHVHITYFVVGQFFTSSIGQNSLTRLDRAYSVLELDMIATFILCYLASFSIYCVFWGNLRHAGAEWHLKFLGGPCIIVMASR